MHCTAVLTIAPSGGNPHTDDPAHHNADDELAHAGANDQLAHCDANDRFAHGMGGMHERQLPVLQCVDVANMHSVESTM